MESLTDVVPDEVWLHIFSFIEGKRLLNTVALVCRQWQSLTEDEELWERQVRRLMAERPRLTLAPPPASEEGEQADDAPRPIEVWDKAARKKARKKKRLEKNWWAMKTKAESWVKPKGRTWKWLYQAKTNVYTTVEEGVAPTGVGRYEWRDEAANQFAWVEGDWLEGRLHGAGIKWTRENGRDWFCVGEFVANTTQGEASAVWSTPFVLYEGHWVDDKPHGHGVKCMPKEGRYSGEWANGSEAGRGKHVWNDGSYYDGEWLDGGQNGTGTYFWKSGNYFTGEWKACNNVKGVYVWLDGRTYEGHYHNSNKHGQGTYAWPDGSKYSGEWENGLRHGRGRMDWPDGTYFLGMWHRDDRQVAEETNLARADWAKRDRLYDLYFLEDGEVWDRKYGPDIQERRRQRKLALEEEKLRRKLEQLQLQQPQ